MAKGIKFDYQLTDNTSDVLNASAEAIYRALTEVGMEAQARVASLVPVDTGRLRNSITYQVEDAAVVVGTNVEYAQEVEFNEHARHTTGQAHYLRDGISNNVGEFKRIINDVLSGN